MRYPWFCLSAAALMGAARGLEAQAPTLLERVRNAMRLPEIVDSVRRNAGASEADVRGVLVEQQRRKIPANEAHDVLQAANEAAREHGPVDNFGAFVQARLASGLRGRALAQAIRQEHARAGKGGGNARASQAGGRQDSANRGRSKAADTKAPDAAGKRPLDAGTKGAAKQAGATTGARNKGKGRP